jgi:3D (Asp-Asp-Asp) domain-containing protein
MKYKTISILLVVIGLFILPNTCNNSTPRVENQKRYYKYTLMVTASCYRANMNECDSTPLITADGSHIDINRVDKLRWIAISRDLEKYHKMGDTILVEGIGKGFDGYWIVHDRMNSRFKKKIDFLISDKIEADLFKKVIIRFN